MSSHSGPTTVPNAAGVLYSFLAGALLNILILCGALSLTPTIASATGGPPTAQQSLSWSVAEIAKPTQTTSPVPTPTALPTETPVAPTASTEPTSALAMSIVEETATPSTGAQDQPPVNAGGKYILVSISQQHLYAYDHGDLVFSFVVSTGMGNSTRVGTFHVLDKIPNAYGANWNFWMPDWMGIYWSGSLENGIHALPLLPGGARLWSGYLGTPISFGCVVLGVDEALQLYNWADIGTPVEIRR
jgi:lipoprotein-anchoring transpeptidase ErfK/SrfK